jgi:hypothetical protein
LLESLEKVNKNVLKMLEEALTWKKPAKVDLAGFFASSRDRRQSLHLRVKGNLL